MKKPRLNPGWPKLKRDWVDRYVKLSEEVITKGGVHFKAGEIMKVTRNHGGLELVALTNCPTCERGFRHFVRGVNQYSVELLPDDFKP